MAASTYTEIRRLRETSTGSTINNTASSHIERLKMMTIHENMEKALNDSSDDEDDYLREKVCYFNIPYCPLISITKIQHKYTDMSIKDISVWYHMLAEVIESINILLNEYSNGEFQTLAKIFTQGVFQELSIKLVNLRNLHHEFRDYEKIRRSTVLALQGLYQSLLQYGTYMNLQFNYEKCKERAAILTDPKKLKEYIDEMRKKNVSIFPDAKITTIAVKIKPEYLEYIKLYGYPAGNIFDMDKLGEIIERLKHNESSSSSSSESDTDSECEDEYPTKCEECSS